MDRLQKNSFLLIGVDGGASKVSSWLISVNETNDFTLGAYHSVRQYRNYPDFDTNFQPVDINRQLSERDSGQIEPTSAERKQGLVYSQACADSIIEICRQSKRSTVLIGVGMPGLKTDDQRGTAVMANGPRHWDYCDQVEAKLKQAGIDLVAPIDQLGSDAYFCGLGEEYARDGQFRNVANAYYLGGGSGAADAVKLQNKVVALDDLSDWFVKTWELQCPENRSLETYVSSRGIQALYAELSGRSLEELNRQAIYPPQIRDLAGAGDAAARETFAQVSKYLALLLYERITTLFAGWQGIFSFVDPQRAQPNADHPYRDNLFDRIVIGQRLGDLLSESIEDDIFGQPFIQNLTTLINESSVLNEVARKHYCTGGKLAKGFITISKIREAPALGAAVDAYLHYTEVQSC